MRGRTLAAIVFAAGLSVSSGLDAQSCARLADGTGFCGDASTWGPVRRAADNVVGQYRNNESGFGPIRTAAPGAAGGMIPILLQTGIRQTVAGGDRVPSLGTEAAAGMHRTGYPHWKSGPGRRFDQQQRQRHQALTFQVRVGAAE